MKKSIARRLNQNDSLLDLVMKIYYNVSILHILYRIYKYISVYYIFYIRVHQGTQTLRNNIYGVLQPP